MLVTDPVVPGLFADGGQPRHAATAPSLGRLRVVGARRPPGTPFTAVASIANPKIDPLGRHRRDAVYKVGAVGFGFEGEPARSLEEAATLDHGAVATGQDFRSHVH